MASFEKIKKNLSIKIRLRGFITLIVSLAVVFCVYSIHSVLEIYNQNIKIENDNIVHLQNLNNLSENLNRITIEGKNYVLTNNLELKTISQKSIKTDIENIDIAIDEFGQSLNDEGDTKLFNSLRAEFEKYKNIINEIIKLSDENKEVLVFEISSKSENLSYQTIQLIIQKLKTNISEEINKNFAAISEFKNTTISNLLTFAIIIAALSLLLGFLITNDIVASLRKLKDNLVILGNGVIPNQHLPEYKDDIGLMGVACNKITNTLKNAGEIANRISLGNYESDFQPLSEKDILGNSLLNLQQNLQKAKGAEDSRKIEEKQHGWVTQGLAQFSDILRSSSSNFNDFANEIIKNIINYVGANQGGLFIYHDQDPENTYLELLAAYAYDRKKYLQKQIKIGEGLVGTCAIEKATIYLTEIPADYIEIGSGLGRAKPSSLLIVPLKIQEDIFGVLEIASFVNLPQFQIEFIEKIADNIAITLSTARINAKTTQLFEESKIQSEILESQDKELRETLKEMKHSQEEALEREVERRGIINAIDNSVIKAEYLVDGTLTSANINFLRTYQYTLEEVLDKNIRTFIPQEEYENFIKNWAKLKENIPFKGVFQRLTQSNNVIWLLMSYTPIKNKIGIVTKVLLLANDITQLKNFEQTNLHTFQKLSDQKKEIEESLNELNRLYTDKIGEQKDSKQLYEDTLVVLENEINQMYSTHINHLEKVEQLNLQLSTQNQNLEEYKVDLNLYKKTIEEQNEKLLNSRHQMPATNLATSNKEIEEHYLNWLNDVISKKTFNKNRLDID